MSEDGESSRSPDGESLDGGSHMVELIYYNVPGRTDRSRRGKAYRNRSDGELRCFEAHDGVKYRPGDHVYIDGSSTEPFIIGSISQFKMNKRECLSVKVTRFFRPEEVPDMSISVILQERNELVEQDVPIVDTHARELFTSESAQTYPISSLRGKCDVTFVKDFRSLDGCDLSKCDSFFSCLAYNQDSLRLAAVQGEIRVGGAFQAKLPPEATSSVGDEPDRDELVYRPGQINEQTEKTYIRLARSFRMFSMMNDQKTQSVEKNARVSDLLLDDAIGTLHRCGYKYDEALKEMNANDKLLSADPNFMTPEDTKKFSKGIRTYGKNFLRISRELLPMHSREQLVAYYYLWKKTADATKPKALARPRNPVAAVKKAKNGNNKASRPASTEYNDYASASESDVEEGRISHYACHHCYSSDSKDWHHAGRDGLLLCTDCRVFFKKYGQLRPVDRPSTVPPTLFKRSSSGGTDHEEEGVRTRAGKNGRRRTPSMGDERRSPSQAVSVHEFDMEKTTKHKNGKRKKSHVNGTAKRKKVEEKEATPPIEEVEEKAVPEIKAEPSSASESTMSDSPVKEEPVQNGFHDEVKEEEKPDIKEVLAVEPSTSRSGEDVIFSKCDDDSDGEYYDPNEDPTWETGNEIAYQSKNAIFVQATVRKVGHRCSRTDFQYRLKPGSVWDETKKKRDEKAKNPPPQAVPSTPQMTIKKPEINGIVDSRLPPQMTLDQHALAAAMQAMLQQQQAQAQHQQQQQAHAQAAAAHMQLMEQQQQMAKMEMQRQQMILQSQAASRMVPHILDQRVMAGLMPPVVPPGMPSAEQRMVMEMMAQAQMAQHMQQLQMTAAANAPPQQAMMTPDMQQLMLSGNQHMFQQLLQQQQMANMANAMANMHPAMAAAAGSDMMRRLQQEGHRSFPQ